MHRLARAAPLLVSAAVAAACVQPGPHQPRGCNPLLDDPERCLLPFPSSWYLAEGQQTATGLRVRFPDDVLPANADGVRLSTDRLNRFDGFSPATPLLVSFPEGVDPAALSPVRLSGGAAGADYSGSLERTSTVQVVDLARGERVPLFAELDANSRDPERRMLIIRPQVRLQPATRYAVVLRGLRTAGGEPLPPPAPFRALRDGTRAQKPELEELRPRYEGLFAELEQLGVPRSELILAWDFTTASEATITAPMVEMRDSALAQVDAGQLGYELTAVRESSQRHLYREIEGLLEVPAFLDGTGPGAQLRFDAEGRATSTGVARYPFLVHVPRCAATATGPLPVMLFGHGIFGGTGEMSSSFQRELIETLCVVQVGMPWIGLAEEDRAFVVIDVLGEFSRFAAVSDRLRQAQVNFVVLARQVLRSLKDDPALRVDGRPITDASELYYLGISNGGIQGAAFLALSPDVERGTLMVGGGPWSLLMSRSNNFAALGLILNQTYPDPLDQQLLVALTQPLWDYTDPLNYAGRLQRDPLPGSAPKPVLVHEAIADSQVPNLGTRMIVRESGIPALAPLLEPVHGVEPRPGPLGSAYVQWDVGVPPEKRPSDQNVPADLTPAHDRARLLAPSVEQLRRFFRPDGAVEATCPEEGCLCPGKPVAQSAFLTCR